MTYKGYKITMIDRQTWRVISPDGAGVYWFNAYADARRAIRAAIQER